LNKLASAILLLCLSATANAQSEFDEAKLLAEQGDAEAQLNLGIRYANGEGVPEDDAEAVKWYRLAAKQGLARAQSYLGIMYGNGDGVPENYAEAVKWFRLAAAQGQEDAKRNRDIVAERLTPDQLTQAQQIATRCIESDYQDCEWKNY
jgi:TPR repeat protein